MPLPIVTVIAVQIAITLALVGLFSGQPAKRIHADTSLRKAR